MQVGWATAYYEVKRRQRGGAKRSEAKLDVFHNWHGGTFSCADSAPFLSDEWWDLVLWKWVESRVSFFGPNWWDGAPRCDRSEIDGRCVGIAKRKLNFFRHRCAKVDYGPPLPRLSIWFQQMLSDSTEISQFSFFLPSLEWSFANFLISCGRLLRQ